jgi:cytochrome c oxidase cbb3-type subunit 2
MPSWHMLSEKERLSVIQYIKFELAVDRSDPRKPFVIFHEEQPARPIHIARPPEPSAELVAQGKQIWQKAKCWECHGQTGKGDGEKAAGLKDDNKFAIVPADLTSGQFKSGPSVRDIFRTISTGLSGTPMPSYSASFDDAQRWALSYYVLSLSAFTDPLTRKPLAISEKDRATLNDPALRAASSKDAYSPTKRTAADARPAFGGAAWAKRRGIETVEPVARWSAGAADTVTR